jgi:spore maturation protein CgeB
MNFRFLQFATVYPEFAEQFLAANPDHITLSYDEIYARLIGMHYSLGDAYVSQIRAHGNLAVYHSATLEPLQKAWAREHGIAYGARSWLKDILLAQVRHFDPDVIFLQDTMLFDRKLRQQLREALRHPILLVGWRASVTPDFSVFGDLDIVLTAGPHFVDEFRRHGANAYLLPLAFDDRVLRRLPPRAEPDLEFSFVGTVGTPNGPHAERYGLIERLLQSGLLQVWGEEQVSHGGLRQAVHRTVYQIHKALDSVGVSEATRAALPVIGRAAGWHRDPAQPALGSLFAERMHQAVFGLDALEILARSKMSLNCHIGAAGKYAGNNRLYEATGVGTCLITDCKQDLDRYFKPDLEVVAYRSAEDCLEKVRYLLAHDAERKTIAAAGQRRTLADHTYVKRTECLIDIIQAALAK